MQSNQQREQTGDRKGDGDANQIHHPDPFVIECKHPTKDALGIAQIVFTLCRKSRVPNGAWCSISSGRHAYYLVNPIRSKASLSVIDMRCLISFYSIALRSKHSSKMSTSTYSSSDSDSLAAAAA